MPAMPSHRKRKREAASRDLSLRELELLEVLEEVLESLRWQQVLGYANQFLLDRHVRVEPDERDRVLDAAVRAVDKDKHLRDWRDRLARLRAGIHEVGRALDAEPARADAHGDD